MALANYADLQTSVASWMNRTDLGAQIPDFIAIAEARINSVLRVREQVKTASLSTVAGVQTVTLPADWLEFVALSTGGVPMELGTSDGIRSRAAWYTASPLTPATIAIEGDTLLLSPTPDAVYVIDAQYYSKVPPLATSSTNWLLTKHPNVYLYGALVSGYHFTMNDERANFFGNLYAQAVAGVKASHVRALSSGSPLTVRARR